MGRGLMTLCVPVEIVLQEMNLLVPLNKRTTNGISLQPPFRLLGRGRRSHEPVQIILY